jgi:hypothetical protein
VKAGSRIPADAGVVAVAGKVAVWVDIGPSLAALALGLCGRPYQPIS